MIRASTALAAAAFCGAAWGQAPTYSTASIVNASDFAPGPFAPNGVLAIFGANLAFTTATLDSSSSTSGLPFQLGHVSVYIDNTPVPLLFVSAGQINCLIPPNEIPGDVPLRVVRQGVTGPNVTITLVNSAPALFAAPDKTALAQDYNAKYAVATADAPAHPGDLLVLYATGLGPTQTLPLTGEIPAYGSSITASSLSSFQLLLNGKAIDPDTVKYAGLTPGFAGLYQINFYLPGDCPKNPQIQVAVGQQISSSDVTLAVQ